MTKTYHELKADLAASLAQVKTAQDQIDAIQPPEVWVVTFTDRAMSWNAFDNEADAKAFCPGIQKDCVRYVLPPQTNTEQNKSNP
jgi:hypothetical protein